MSTANSASPTYGKAGTRSSPPATARRDTPRTRRSPPCPARSIRSGHKAHPTMPRTDRRRRLRDCTHGPPPDPNHAPRKLAAPQDSPVDHRTTGPANRRPVPPSSGDVRRSRFNRPRESGEVRQRPSIRALVRREPDPRLPHPTYRRPALNPFSAQAPVGPRTLGQHERKRSPRMFDPAHGRDAGVARRGPRTIAQIRSLGARFADDQRRRDQKAGSDSSGSGLLTCSYTVGTTGFEPATP